VRFVREKVEANYQSNVSPTDQVVAATLWVLSEEFIVLAGAVPPTDSVTSGYIMGVDAAADVMIRMLGERKQALVGASNVIATQQLVELTGEDE